MEKVVENMNNLSMNVNCNGAHRQGAAREPQPGTSTQTEKPQKQENGTQHNCNKSCSELMSKLSECVICLHPLQNTNVSACSRCGSFWCGACAKRISSCPFCRAPPPDQPCLALRRLLSDLALPCKNLRWGCSDMVSTDTRRHHEMYCPYGHIKCPFSESCRYTFKPSILTSHIYRVHQMSAVEDNTLNIKIYSFPDKISTSDVSGYMRHALMVAYDNIFLVKVSLRNFDLDVKIIKKEFAYVMPNNRTRIYKGFFYAVITFQSSNINSSYKIILDDDFYSKKGLVSRNDLMQRTWPGEDASVIITISHMNDKSSYCTINM